MPPKPTSCTFLPFLYPFLPWTSSIIPAGCRHFHSPPQDELADAQPTAAFRDLPLSRLNPSTYDYSASTFTDKVTLTLQAGRGGHGCISFHREAFRPDGPPDGGDGGPGGCIYVQAVPGETSLHKLARRRVVRAGRGTSGKGSRKTGTRGDDMVLLVPVGTVVREMERTDPVAEDEERRRMLREMKRERRRRELESEAGRVRGDGEGKEESESKGCEEAEGKGKDAEAEALAAEIAEREREDHARGKFLIYPGVSKSEARNIPLPRVPHLPRSVVQPPPPIQLDLSHTSVRPLLLAAGGTGGFGNPHFVSRENSRPVVATRGTDGVTVTVEFELKLLADIGLVGLPNAGKSTLLRALSNSRTRVGSWAFTTLRPNVGTVVLDKYQGRPTVSSFKKIKAGEDGDDVNNVGEQRLERRNRFTVADIPGLIEDAHLNKGLGIEFLRHVERAAVLAFVLDLKAGSAVAALKALWREVGLYSQMREEEERAKEVGERIDWGWERADETSPSLARQEEEKELGRNITAKPWFVVANKGDLPETEASFNELRQYLDRVTAGEEPHPSGLSTGWTERCVAIPVSAILGQGVDRVVQWMVELLDG